MAEPSFRFAIPGDMVLALDRLLGSAGERDDLPPGGVMLSLGMLAGVLAPDGRVFACEIFSGGPWYASGNREACFLVACGADDRAAPELLRLLPPRPPNAADCAGCGGRGRERGSGWPCPECGGLGWVRPDAEQPSSPAPSDSTNTQRSEQGSASPASLALPGPVRQNGEPDRGLRVKGDVRHDDDHGWLGFFRLRRAFEACSRSSSTASS